MSDQNAAAAAFSAAAVVITPLATAVAQFAQQRWAANSRDKVRVDLELLKLARHEGGLAAVDALAGHIDDEISHIAWRERNEKRNVRGALWSVLLAYVGALALYLEVNPDLASWLTKVVVIRYVGWAAAFTFIPAGVALFVCAMVRLPRDDRGRILLYGWDEPGDKRVKWAFRAMWPGQELFASAGR